MLAQRDRIDIGDRHPAQADGAAGRHHRAGGDQRERALAGTGGADHGHHLAGSEREVDVQQRGDVPAVGVRDAGQFQRAGLRNGGPLGNGHGDHPDHPHQRGAGGLDLIGHPHQRTDRVEQPVEQQRGGGHGAGGDHARIHEEEPHDQQQRQHRRLGAVVPAEGPGDEVEHPDRQVAGQTRGIGDPLEFGVLGVVGVQGPRAGDPAEETAGPRAERGALLRVDRSGPRQIPAQRRPVHGQRHQPHQPEPPVHGDQPHAGDDHGEQRLHHQRDHRGGGLADLAGVLRHAGDQVAGLGPFHLRCTEPQRPVHHPLAQPGHRRLGQPGQPGLARPRAQCAHDSGRRDRPGTHQHHGAVLGVGENVDQPADHPRRHQTCHRADQPGQAHEQQETAALPQQWPEHRQ